MNNGLERMWSWPNLRFYPVICLEGPELRQKNYDNLCMNRDTNQATRKCKSDKLLTTEANMKLANSLRPEALPAVEVDKNLLRLSTLKAALMTGTEMLPFE